MTAALVCWHCGASLKDVPMPLSRLSECLACHAELYVCRMCRFHDSKLRHGCREERAEHVQEKERANFCEYFVPMPNAFQPVDRSGDHAARTQLDALFSGKQNDADADATHSALEDLFKAGDKRD
ncbi:MAG: hypothetical protein ACRESU_04760 [Gammaproteobacteria bacterium]